eukprot:s432_g11.t2
MQKNETRPSGLDFEAMFSMMVLGFCTGVCVGTYQDASIKPLYDMMFSKSAQIWQLCADGFRRSMLAAVSVQGKALEPKT